MKYDYIIIGGGLAGLVSGIIVAKENKKVLILEQHTKPGGYLHSFHRKGHQFETGFHFVPELSENGILNMYWQYLGIMDKIKIVPYNKKHFHTLIFPDFKVDLPSGLSNLKDKLSELFPNETKRINTYIEEIQKLRTYFVYFNQNHKGDLEKEHESFNISISDYLDGIGCSQKLKAVILAHSFLYGVEPKNTPLGTHAIFFNALYSSIYDIEGGGDRLAAALKESFLENGGELLLKNEVTNIVIKDKKIAGVITSTEQFYECENIISTINPQTTLKMFTEKIFRNAYTDRIIESQNTNGHFGGYFTTTRDLSKHNFDTLYFPDYDINQIYNNPVSNPIDDFFIYYTIPTARLGTSQDRHIIETLSLDNYKNYSKWHDSKFGKRPKEYHDLKEKIVSKTITLLEKLLPDIKGGIEFKEGSTPLTNLHYTKSPEGSMYGIKHTMDQMHAPIRARTKLDGFYLSGQSLIFPGIVGVSITGFVTCSEIFGQEYIFNKIDKSLGLNSYSK